MAPDSSTMLKFGALYIVCKGSTIGVPLTDTSHLWYIVCKKAGRFVPLTDLRSCGTLCAKAGQLVCL
jgi:hypothetical protein